MTAKTKKNAGMKKRGSKRPPPEPHNATRGKPTPGRLDPEQRKTFFEALNRPIPLRYACDLANIPRRTIYDWIERGTKPDATAVYREFAEEVARAQGLGVASLAEEARTQAAGDYRAMHWYLSRMAPDDFGDPGKRTSADVDRRKAELELRESEARVRLAEAKAAAAEKLSASGSGGAMLVGLAALLEGGALSTGARAEVEALIAAQGAVVLESADLTTAER